MIYDDNSGEYFYEVEDFICHLEDCDVPPSEWPENAYECKRGYSKVLSFSCVAEGLLEDVLWRPGDGLHNWMIAENIAEWFYESTYEFVDSQWPDPDFEGVKDLQWALDWFMFWNTVIFRLLGEYSWFDPAVYCIGPNVLQAALERFQQLNWQKHFTFVADYNKPISLVEEKAKAIAEWEAAV